MMLGRLRGGRPARLPTALGLLLLLLPAVVGGCDAGGPPAIPAPYSPPGGRTVADVLYYFAPTDGPYSDLLAVSTANPGSTLARRNFAWDRVSLASDGSRLFAAVAPAVDVGEGAVVVQELDPLTLKSLRTLRALGGAKPTSLVKLRLSHDGAILYVGWVDRANDDESARIDAVSTVDGSVVASLTGIVRREWAEMEMFPRPDGSLLYLEGVAGRAGTPRAQALVLVSGRDLAPLERHVIATDLTKFPCVESPQGPVEGGEIVCLQGSTAAERSLALLPGASVIPVRFDPGWMPRELGAATVLAADGMAVYRVYADGSPRVVRIAISPFRVSGSLDSLPEVVASTGPTTGLGDVGDLLLGWLTPGTAEAKAFRPLVYASVSADGSRLVFTALDAAAEEARGFADTPDDYADGLWVVDTATMTPIGRIGTGRGLLGPPLFSQDRRRVYVLDHLGNFFGVDFSTGDLLFAEAGHRSDATVAGLLGTRWVVDGPPSVP